MPDVFADIAGAPLPLLEMIANVLELRAAMPQQQEMQRTYLRDIEFPEGAKVLEAGCGTGAVARVVAAWPCVAEVVGVDPSPYLIDRARTLSSHLPNVVFEVGDGRALSWKDESFDVVVLHTVLTHVRGPEAMLAEAHRVLRPGGWLASAMVTSRRRPWPPAISIPSRSVSTRSSTGSCRTTGWSDA